MLYQCLLHFFILFLKCVCLCVCISQRLMSSILLNCSSIFLDFISFYGCFASIVSVYHVHAWCLWGQDRMLDSLELVLRMVVSHHIVVGAESSSSGRVLFRLVVQEG